MRAAGIQSLQCLRVSASGRGLCLCDQSETPMLGDVGVEDLADERVSRDAHLELLEADSAVRVVVCLLQPLLDRLLKRTDSLLFAQR